MQPQPIRLYDEHLVVFVIEGYNRYSIAALAGLLDQEMPGLALAVLQNRPRLGREVREMAEVLCGLYLRPARGDAETLLFLDRLTLERQELERWKDRLANLAAVAVLAALWPCSHSA